MLRFWSAARAGLLCPRLRQENHYRKAARQLTDDKSLWFNVAPVSEHSHNPPITNKYRMQIRIKSQPSGTTLVWITVEASNPSQASAMARSMYNLGPDAAGIPTTETHTNVVFATLA